MTRFMQCPEEVESLALAIAIAEDDDVVVGYDVRKKDWPILPMTDPDCYFLDFQKIVEVPPALHV